MWYCLRQGQRAFSFIHSPSIGRRSLLPVLSRHLGWIVSLNMLPGFTRGRCGRSHGSHRCRQERTWDTPLGASAGQTPISLSSLAPLCEAELFIRSAPPFELVFCSGVNKRCYCSTLIIRAQSAAYLKLNCSPLIPAPSFLSQQTCCCCWTYCPKFFPERLNVLLVAWQLSTAGDRILHRRLK